MSPHTSTTGHRAGLTLALLAFAQFVVGVDYNIVYVALPEIGSALGFTPQSLQWVVSAFAVAFGGFLLFGGRAVDFLGARRLFITGLWIFGLACLLGGFAQNPTVLITARAIQGFGAALLTPATLGLIHTHFSQGAARNRAIAIWGGASSGGLAVGAVLGGVLTDAWGWEWVLFILVPLALVAAISATSIIVRDARPARSKGGFDILGALLATGGSSLLVLGLVSGPEVGWLSLRGVGSIAAGVGIFALFVLVELKGRTPLLPMRLFRNRSLVIAILIILIFQSALGGAYYIFTNYLQSVLGYDALHAGLAFLPPTIISMTASFALAPKLLSAWRPKGTLLVGMITNGVGMVMLAAAMSTDAPFLLLLPGLVVWGVGGGITYPSMFACAASDIAPEEAGISSALATSSQQIGGAAGLAVLVAIAVSGLTAGSSGSFAATELAHGLQTAMWIGGVASVIGSVLALALRPKGAPATHVRERARIRVNT